MEDQRFDDLVRSLGVGGPSRRTAIKALAGGALAALVARLGLEEMAAACGKVGDDCKRNRDCCAGARCKGKRCRCKRNLTVCGGRCRNLLTDKRNCGACGVACGQDEVCRSEECVVSCGNPGVCGEAPECGVPFADCSCVFRSAGTGGGVCARSGGQSCDVATACSSDSDCPEGKLCVVSCCADEGKPTICAFACATGNPAPARGDGSDDALSRK